MTVSLPGVPADTTTAYSLIATCTDSYYQVELLASSPQLELPTVVETIKFCRGATTLATPRDPVSLRRLNTLKEIPTIRSLVFMDPGVLQDFTSYPKAHVVPVTSLSVIFRNEGCMAQDTTATLVSCLPNLKKLQLCFPPPNYMPMFISKIKPHSGIRQIKDVQQKDLQCADFTTSDFQRLAVVFPNLQLETLSLACHRTINQLEVSKMPKFANVNRLDVSTTLITATKLIALLSHFPSVQTINLTSCSQFDFSEEELDKPFKGVTRIESLNCFPLAKIEREMLQKVFPNAAIKEANVTTSDNVTPLSLMAELGNRHWGY